MIVELQLEVARMRTGRRDLAIAAAAKDILALEQLLKDAGWTGIKVNVEMRDTYDSAATQARRNSEPTSA